MGRFDLTGIITDRYVTHDILRCCIEDRYLVATLHADVDFFRSGSSEYFTKPSLFGAPFAIQSYKVWYSAVLSGAA